jgi:hypothetical protein
MLGVGPVKPAVPAGRVASSVSGLAFLPYQCLERLAVGSRFDPLPSAVDFN